MNLQKKQGLRLCAAVGAAAGVGPAIYRDLASSFGWLAALPLSMLVSAVVAMATSVIIGLFLKTDDVGNSHTKEPERIL
jgi:hypothetical protein